MLKMIHVLILLMVASLFSAAFAQNVDETDSLSASAVNDVESVEVAADALRQQKKLDRALEMINEVSNRRRLTTFFVNSQSLDKGVQHNYVNVGSGNLTFANRDLVVIDRIPIVLGRVYDSSGTGTNDFGEGWKLTVGEQVDRGPGDTIVYTDTNNATFMFRIAGRDLVPLRPQEHGIRAGIMERDRIELRGDSFDREFEKSGTRFVLHKISDRWGNSLTFHYRGDALVGVNSSNGRHVSIDRDNDGRILSMRDDLNRVVEYSYDKDRQLAAVSSFGRQWKYEYDQGSRLVSVVDPRDELVAEAQYSKGGRVQKIRVLHSQATFDYRGDTTIATNALNQELRFTQNGAGLTTSILDHSGATTALSLDRHGRPESFTLNDNVVAQFTYSVEGRPTGAKSFGGQETEIHRMDYNDQGFLASISKNGLPVAKFRYGEVGELSSIVDESGLRQFAYSPNGDLRGIQFGESTLELTSNDMGQLTRASYGPRKFVGLQYDEWNRVQDIDFSGDEIGHYDYEDGMLRSAITYASGRSLALTYDAVGNMIRISREDKDGTVYSDDYEVGASNLLHAIRGNRGTDFSFEYDQLGRLSDVTAVPRSMHVEYDELSRVASARIDDENVFQAAYSPMDADSAIREDDRTFFTSVFPRAARGVFGSIDEIVYTRPRSTNYGLVRFDGDLGRFVLASMDILSPDLIQSSSLARRQIQLNESGEFPGPTFLDKPSNPMFIPPELVSVNCSICRAAVIFNHSLKINGSTNPPPVLVGQFSNFQSTATVNGCVAPFGFDDNNQHTVFYKDGSSSWGITSGLVGNFVSGHVYSTPGTYNVDADMECLCGLFAFSTASRQIEVQPFPVVVRLTFDDGPTSNPGNDNTRDVINALKTNPVQTNIPATFFVQTHAPGRGNTTGGIANMEDALADGHNIMIHTGSDSDHTLHIERVLAPAYVVIPYALGANALESDMQRAKQHIDSLQGGPLPTLVRAPELAKNPSVDAVYVSQGLTHAGVDVQSGDDVGGANYASIAATLVANLSARIAQGDRDIIILFHDIHSHTADNLAPPDVGYLALIESTIAEAGGQVVFAKL